MSYTGGWANELLSGHAVHVFFFPSLKPIAGINCKWSRSLPGVDVVPLFGFWITGKRNHTLGFEANRVRFGLNYTRHGYLT